MIALRDAELRGARELVRVAGSNDTEEPFGRQTLELLARLVPAHSIGYYEWSLEWPYRLDVKVEAPDDVVWSSPDVKAATLEYCSTYPLNIVHLRLEPRARKISDFLSARELHRLDYYDYVLRPFGIEHQLRLYLPAPPMRSHAFYFNRDRAHGDFSPHDIDLLNLIRPFLIAFRERRELPQLTAAPDAHGLTAREQEVLDWVACGKTNPEIAALLVVSPLTVRTHLEHIYEKLGVHCRTAAVAAVGLGSN